MTVWEIRQNIHRLLTAYSHEANPEAINHLHAGLTRLYLRINSENPPRNHGRKSINGTKPGDTPMGGASGGTKDERFPDREA